MADQLDQLLKTHFAESSEYLSDEGFTEALMGHIPKTPARRWWLSKAVLTAGAVVPALLILMFTPWAHLWQTLWTLSLQDFLVMGVGFSVAVMAGCFAWLLREIMA